MQAVAAGPDRFVAVGATDTDEGPVGTAWVSVDGRTWQRAEAELGAGDPTGVLWDGERFVAYGGGAGVVSAAVWTSPDGLLWQRAPLESPFDDVTALHVTDASANLVAIGGAFGGDGGEGPLPAVSFSTWTSVDGLAWQLVPPTNSAPELNALGGLTSANGVLVAWGKLFTEADERAVTVRSTDGQTWELATLGSVGNSIGQIIGDDGRFVAVGSGPYCCEAGATAPVKAWTSSDGSAWMGGDFQPAGSDHLARVVRSGGRYVALGTSAGNAISYLSADGSVWTAAESVPDAAVDGDPCVGGPCPFTTVRGLAGGRPGLVAVGDTKLEDDEGHHLGWRSVVWIAPAVEQ